MQVKGKSYRTIWLNEAGKVCIIDQRNLPHRFEICELQSCSQVATAIREMWVRGAPLIGGAAAFGMYLACQDNRGEAEFIKAIRHSADILLQSRPTAVNLAWAVEKQLTVISNASNKQEAVLAAKENAQMIVEQDVQICESIGEHGLPLLQEISKSKNGETVNILTHCNAGWLATIDWGTATAPIYKAHRRGIPVHVWVDETRPRNQGARITAFELGMEGIPHTIITDNTGGHLMQHGMVDICITGTDRTTRTGDVANKIGTYLKALAAFDNQIPFYVALPSPTIDWNISNGIAEIPIEQRSESEVKCIQGLLGDDIVSVQLAPDSSPCANYAFDVTPARLVTGLITERGVCSASEEGLASLFPDFG